MLSSCQPPWGPSRQPIATWSFSRQRSHLGLNFQEKSKISNLVNVDYNFLIYIYLSTGQLRRTGSPPPPCGPGIRTQTVTFDGNHLYRLSHFLSFTLKKKKKKSNSAWVKASMTWHSSFPQSCLCRSLQLPQGGTGRKTRSTVPSSPSLNKKDSAVCIWSPDLPTFRKVPSDTIPVPPPHLRTLDSPEREESETYLGSRFPPLCSSLSSKAIIAACCNQNNRGAGGSQRKHNKRYKGIYQNTHL